MTIINALAVKEKIKNVFLENHIFTRFNLFIPHAKTENKKSEIQKVLLAESVHICSVQRLSVAV